MFLHALALLFAWTPSHHDWTLGSSPFVEIRNANQYLTKKKKFTLFNDQKLLRSCSWEMKKKKKKIRKKNMTIQSQSRKLHKIATIRHLLFCTSILYYEYIFRIWNNEFGVTKLVGFFSLTLYNSVHFHSIISLFNLYEDYFLVPYFMDLS